MSLPSQGDDHTLRTLVAESLEVFEITYTMLTVKEPPETADAANEIQQAYKRITAKLAEMG